MNDTRTDIVRRLRLDASPRCPYKRWDDLAPLALEAADEIDRLRIALTSIALLEGLEGDVAHQSFEIARDAISRRQPLPTPADVAGILKDY